MSPIGVPRLLYRVTLIPRFMNRQPLASTHFNLGTEHSTLGSTHSNNNSTQNTTQAVGVPKVAPLLWPSVFVLVFGQLDQDHDNNPGQIDGQARYRTVLYLD